MVSGGSFCESFWRTRAQKKTRLEVRKLQGDHDSTKSFYCVSNDVHAEWYCFISLDDFPSNSLVDWVTLYRS